MTRSNPFSRRTFLGYSALAAGAPLTSASTATPHVAGGEKTLRLGLIGCGGRGTGAAVQALRTEGPIELVAMGDAFSDRLDSSLGHLRKQSGLEGRVKVDSDHRFVGFDAWRKVLATDVDVVVLATPPHFRPQHFAGAVDADKHVFMEKPVAVDGHGVRTVLDAAKKADAGMLKVGVGLQRHHDDGYSGVIQRVHDGAIGEIVAARAYWNMGSLWHKDRDDGWSDMEWQLRNWLYFAWLSGDHIVEQHIHNLDVVNWAKKAHPVRAHGLGGREVRTDPKFGHIFDHHAVQFEYEDGCTMFSQCRQIDGCANRVSEHLIGTEGKVDFERGYHLHGAKTWSFKGPRQTPYQTEHDRLFAAIRQDTPHNEAVYGAESTMTAIMGRMATYSGKVVTWEQALASERLGPETYEWGDLPVPPVARPGR